MKTRIIEHAESRGNVLLSFAPVIYLENYTYLAIVALGVEINSIFIHFRQILLFLDLKQTIMYRINFFINMGTFIIFRFVGVGWMIKWFIINRLDVPVMLNLFITSGLILMTIINVILIYRLILRDFIQSSATIKNKHELSKDH
ncbi:unnamed protein product [Didymodactylos carnosus]|uniref:TLC domain-containing protein n=1 Tax=Didymodactylos carnosus TaxID=1234261 RepID=A0A814PD72_9BILA|nr:unnamed protein product [Didymodactylos carnosus]CAF3870956.1 unnamed protein product [Didymodactylos carnosus]